MDISNITIPALERKAGVKTNAVRNILTGRSKNPNIDTLKAIARALECSLEELIASEQTEGNLISETRLAKVEDTTLYVQIVDNVLKEYNKKNIAPTISKLNIVVLEIYSYLHSKKKAIDVDFIEWMVERNLK
jgi:transcriptional regulator with XRE-family HTH domain